MRRQRPCAALVVLAVLVSAAAGAADFVVTTDADSGEGSLRAAIAAASASEEDDTITFAGDYTIVLHSPLPQIVGRMEIIGHGWSKTIIDGGPAGPEGQAVRPLEIADGAHLVLEGVMVKSAVPAAKGGAILNHGGTIAYRNTQQAQPAVGYGGHLPARRPQ